MEVLEKVSITEYLASEEKQVQKHHYVAGEIIPMSGGTLNHNVIATRITHQLESQLENRNSPYFVMNSDMKIAIDTIEVIRYPDAVVVCDKVEYYQGRKDVIVNPIFIAEVLSKSTASQDLGPKFEQYKFIPTLQEYLLVDQYKPYASTYFKVQKDTWKNTTAMDVNDDLYLASLDCHLSLKKIYRNIFNL